MEFLDVSVAHFVLGGLVIGGLRPILQFARRRRALPAVILSVFAIGMLALVNIARGFVLPSLLIFLALSLVMVIPRSFPEIAMICFISTVTSGQLLDNASSLNQALRYAANQKPHDRGGNSTLIPSADAAPFQPVWNPNQFLLGLRQGSSLQLKESIQLHEALMVNFDRIRIQGAALTSDWIAPTATPDGRAEDDSQGLTSRWSGASLTLPRLIVFGDHFRASNLTIASTSFGSSLGKIVIRGRRATLSNVFIHLAGGWTDGEPPLLIQEGTTLSNVVLISSSDVKGVRLDVENCQAISADGVTTVTKGYRCFSSAEIAKIESISGEPIPLSVRCRELMPESLRDATSFWIEYLQDDVLPAAKIMVFTMMQGLQLFWRFLNIAVGDVFCGIVRGGELQKWENYCVQRLQKMSANEMRNKTSVGAVLSGAAAAAASTTAVQPPKMFGPGEPSALEETVRILTIALMKVGAPVLYRTVVACIQVEMNAVFALTSIGYRGTSVVGGWILPIIHFVSPFLPELHLQDKLVQLVHLLWDAYVSYLVGFLAIEKEVAHWFFYRLLDVFAICTTATQQLSNVALTCFGWYLATTADTQLIIALLQTLYIATRLLAEVRAEREQKAKSWFASLTGGPTSMLQILAKHYASLGSYLYHHGILVVLLLGVSFIPITTIGSVVKHFAFPYQSQRSFLDFLQVKPTKKRLVVTLLARSALSVVVQLIITDVIRGLLWEAWRIAVAGVVIFSGTYLFMKKTSMLDSPTTKVSSSGGQPAPVSPPIADSTATPDANSST